MSNILTIEDVITKAETYNKRQKYEQAIAILEQFQKECAVIPGKYLLKYNDLLEKTKKILQNATYEKKIDNFSRNELLINIFREHNLSIELFYKYIDKYKTDLTPFDLQYFNQIFSNKYIKNSNKLLIYKTFFENRTDFDFTYFNISLQKEFTINPSKDEILAQLVEINALIQKKCFKTPSYISPIKQIMEDFFSYYFPTPVPINKNELVDKVYNYINELMLGVKNTDNEFSQLVMKVTKNE
ncbi:MAG: DUF3196 family protein [Mycoplasmataceae bacterium]|jgi:hypothetical protein|nr:DUF3196 family protein [Mycoplasmataceae bacterium]